MKNRLYTYKVYFNNLNCNRLLFSLRAINNDIAIERAFDIIYCCYSDLIKRFNYFTIFKDSKIIKTILYNEF